MPELILRSGKRAGRRIPLPPGEVIIGRDEDCRIRLTSSDVSRHHCLLRATSSGEVVAADLGSRNGTYVNDVQIAAPTPLRPGDLLRVGPFLFQVPGGAGGERTSDEVISGWLTVEGTVAGSPPPGVKNDTTLMEELDDAGGSGDELLTSAEETVTTPAPKQKDPVVAQAAEIIREYWTSKRGGPR